MCKKNYPMQVKYLTVEITHNCKGSSCRNIEMNSSPTVFKPYSPPPPSPENVVSFLCLLHIFYYTSDLDFFMEANHMNLDQTAPMGAV